ncbi:hypothetical protein DPMN_109482 [Dreissena polymorpha]|uniref:Uncharacterized protein n=1 Tax=Dreissena polymorpha TaxID=45954 RepID=A0A9D4KB43_DREPO|nr:hypothetical protein DPMN_109482 [Dreissena polymorpha]
MLYEVIGRFNLSSRCLILTMKCWMRKTMGRLGAPMMALILKSSCELVAAGSIMEHHVLIPVILGLSWYHSLVHDKGTDLSLMGFLRTVYSVENKKL